MFKSRLDQLNKSAANDIRRGLDNFKASGEFVSTKTEAELVGQTLALILRIYEEIERNESLRLEPAIFKSKLISLLLIFELDEFRSEKYLQTIFNSILSTIPTKRTEDIDLSRKLRTYARVLGEALLHYRDELFKSDVIDILKNSPEYQYSSRVSQLRIVDRDEISNKVYTLFSKNRYFEHWRRLKDEETFSPLDFNNRMARLGYPELALTFVYNDTVIHENKVYKLTTTPDKVVRDSFNADDWTEYTPRNLNLNETFEQVYKQNIFQFYEQGLNRSFEINSIISNSAYEELNSTRSPGDSILNNTWGGEGTRVFNSLIDLQNTSILFGGYEGSIVGAIDYAAIYLEYFFAASLGRTGQYVFAYEDNQSLFGNFQQLFLSRTSDNKIPGLSFLDSFTKSRAFLQNTAVEETAISSARVVALNPIFNRYKDGLEDKSSLIPFESTYLEDSRVDLLLYGIRVLMGKMVILGDTIEAIKNSLDERGRLEEFAGLGNIAWQIDLLQNCFPPTRILKHRGFIAGLSPAIQYFLDSYERFIGLVPNPRIPERTLRVLSNWIDTLYNQFEIAFRSLNKVFTHNSEYIPNISFKTVEPIEFSKFKQFLKNSGLRESEINQVLSVQSFAELVTTFAPLSDSEDLRSLFKAFELSEYIYEFGGQEGFDAYLSFLFSGGEIDNLLNILSLTTKSPSLITKYQSVKYPRLIGLLIGLTYAVDPTQLEKFKIILGENSLTLLESINFLLSNEVDTIIRQPEDIDVLTPLITQSIQPSHTDASLTQSATYPQVKKYAPIGLQDWVEQFENNVNSASQKEKLEGVFDKIVGLTPRELIYILDFKKDTLTPLGELLDGFFGGKFTSFLRYATLAGLTLKLKTYQGSYQVNNFRVQASKFSAFVTLLNELKTSLDVFEITKNLFKDYFQYTPERPSEKLGETFEIIFNAQNKNLDTVSKVLTGLIPTEDFALPLSFERERYRSLSGDVNQIAASPGIGNSPVPNRTQLINSVTPEQAAFLTTEDVRTVVENLDRNGNYLIEKFIKVRRATESKESERLLNPHVIEVSDLRRNPASVKSKDLLDNTPKTRQNLTYEVQPIDKYKDGNPAVVSGVGLGINYIQPQYSSLIDTIERLPPNLLSTKFDSIESCVEFGGNRLACERKYEDVLDKCGSPISKAIVPESYTSFPGQNPSKIYIDRPLGTFGQYKPKSFLLPTNTESPTYYGYLSQIGFDVHMSEGGEPLLTGRSVYPEAIIPPDNSAVVKSEYINSLFGLTEYLKIGIEKDKEISCASLEDPYHFQACVNLLKCKRFSPPLDGLYSLPFCPSGSAGGRLR